MKYQMHFMIDGRVVASMGSDRSFTIQHDNFSDDDGFDLTVFTKWMQHWNEWQRVDHSSTKGVNWETFKLFNSQQEQRTNPVGSN
jgi:hypothetical protein